MNDPFAGGMHLPDIFLSSRSTTWPAARVRRHALPRHRRRRPGRGLERLGLDRDLPGRPAIPPLKLHAAGERNRTLFDLIEANVRMPVKAFGDLRAQLAACQIAEREFSELVARHGADGTTAYTARRHRPCRAPDPRGPPRPPDGQWSFEDWIDDDGVELEKPIRLFVMMTKQDDHMLVDWTGTDRRSRAPSTTPSPTRWLRATPRSARPCPRASRQRRVRVIEVVAPAGTIANGVPPAACAARGLTGFRMVDCAFGCLAMMLPDRVFAASDGGNTGISIGGCRRSPALRRTSRNRRC